MKLDLLYDGEKYRNGTELTKWTGQAWQSRDLITFLRKEALLSSGRLRLLVPLDDEVVETWKKGKILVSKGWVYDIQVFYGVGTTRNGNLREAREIRGAENVFRSIEERMDLEDEFDDEENE